MRWLDSITGSIDMNLSKLREMMEYREAWHAAAHGVRKSWTQLSDWNNKKFLLKIVTLFSKWFYQFSCPGVYASFCCFTLLTALFFSMSDFGGFLFSANNAYSILQSSFSDDDFLLHFYEKIQRSEKTCYNSHPYFYLLTCPPLNMLCPQPRTLLLTSSPFQLLCILQCPA